MRIAMLQKKIVPGDLCWIAEPHDLFYFTGLELSTGELFVAKEEARLFVDGRYIQVAREQTIIPVELAREAAPLQFLQKVGANRLLFHGECTSFDQYQKLASWQKKIPGLQVVAETGFFHRMRSNKDADEVEAMRKSAMLNWQGFQFLCKELRENVTEKELARAFELYVLEHGADALSFSPIIAFGANSAMPHYKPQDVPLKKGDLVLIDIGVILDHYCSDLTRVIAFHSIPKGFDQLYKIVHEAQKAALSHVRPGVKIRELDLAARRIMKREGVEELYLHSLGHGVGLEIHEFPRLRSVGEDCDAQLEAGMAITIEPGLYRAGQGGIRYEDTIIVTKTGYENFYPEMRECSILR